MNKGEFYNAVASKNENLSKKDVSAVIDSTVDTIKEALGHGEKVSLVGFGTFEVKHRNARKARNPKTGESISVPAKDVPVFKAGKELKESL